MKRISLLLLVTVLLHEGFSQNVQDGVKQMYYQHYTAARNILTAVIQKDSGNGEAWYWLGRVMLKQKDNAGAVSVMQKAVSLVSSGVIAKKEAPLVNTGYAHALLETGSNDKANNLIAAALDETKYKDAAVLLAAAQANIETAGGNTAQALEWLEKAAKKDRHNAAIFLARGEAYRKIADGGNAVLSYEQARKTDPSLAEAWYREGLIYKTQQNEEILLDRFMKATDTDSAYAPALYQLYAWYFFRDVNKAAQYLNAYIRHAEPDILQLYMQADLAFVSQQFPAAIGWAQKIIAAEGDTAQARIFKLSAYSYAAQKDSVAAFSNMETYFLKQDTGGLVAKDFVLMAKLYQSRKEDSLAAGWYAKAVDASAGPEEQLGYMSILADIEKEQNHREAEAAWREKIYHVKPSPTNLDIYKWGTALYAASDYTGADSVFAIYEEKYPDQLYGYLWRARSNALIDTSMKEGLAVPHYQKLVEVAAKDSMKNKAVLLNAYGYLGTYEANVKKDFHASLEYFARMLRIDPANEDALKFTATLKKWIGTGN
ncbi:MAG: tetratricopeptide repeat protein [Ferruginibacter sp.]